MEEELKDYWNSQGKKWLVVWNKEMSVDIYWKLENSRKNFIEPIKNNPICGGVEEEKF